MRKNQSIKATKVEALNQALKESHSFVTLNYTSLSSKASTWLRNELKKYDGELQFVSNNVLKRALQAYANSKIELSGQQMVILVRSERISALKFLGDLFKKYKLLKLGVVYAHSKCLDAGQKERLSLWLEKEDVFSKLVYLLNFPLLSLIFRLKAVAEKKT